MSWYNLGVQAQNTNKPAPKIEDYRARSQYLLGRGDK
jgi:hypothetical protein